MRFEKTQIGFVLNEIKKAVAAHVPVVYIPTEQIELIQELFFGKNSKDAILPRVACVEGKDKVLESGEYLDKDNYVISGASPFHLLSSKATKAPEKETINKPTLYVYYATQWSEVKTSIRNFIFDYMDIKLKNAPDVIQRDRIRRSLYIVITPKQLPIPEDIAPYTRIVQIPAMTDEEIECLVLSLVEQNGIDVKSLPKTLLRQMIVSLRGFSSNHIKQILHQIIAEQYIDIEGCDPGRIGLTIQAAKMQMLGNSVGLKWEETPTISSVPGLIKIMQWLTAHKPIFEDPELARKMHMDIPQGILVSGIPGTGKSLIAKTSASILGMPLISLDMGALLGELMGESEHNMINALKKAEQMSPCVLWIDEIEKAFSGSSQNSSSSDGGVGRRMFGKFLTWMQEKSAACFVFATSNDISCLPPELFRSERFDCKYFTFMPMAEECAQILASNIKHQNECFLEEMKKTPEGPKFTCLFNNELEKDTFWLNILNRYCCPSSFDTKGGIPLVQKKNDKNEMYIWKDGHKPRNFKLMTGADLSALIKMAKFRIHSNPNDVIESGEVYKMSEMENALKEILEGNAFKPYGETNLRDIVKCFKKLYDYDFISASGNCIIDFSKYDSDTGLLAHDDDSAENLKHTYDKALYYAIAGAINYYSEKK